MLYAKVVVGLPVEGPFDYSLPLSLEDKACVGSRVKVSFGTRNLTGYIVGLSRKTKIKKIKTILELLDQKPVLDKNMLSLTRRLADYYCCSWGEMIETALPEGIRKGREVNFTEPVSKGKEKSAACPAPVLVHSLDNRLRWEFYLERIKETLEVGKSVLLLSPDKEAASRVAELLCKRFGRQVSKLFRKGPLETEEWCKVRSGESDLIVGTISSIFAPSPNLGLIILEQEEDFAYKQDQEPHYHAREAAFMRAEAEKAGFILGAVSPSLESTYLCRKGKVGYKFIPNESKLPEAKTIDLRLERRFGSRKNTVFAKYLLDAITLSLAAKEKILIFLNRKGFATSASCNSCGAGLRCPRCDINLVYHFRENLMSCHYCNFKMETPNICPSCNAGYIKFSGLGTEKVESELARFFPQARIKRLDETNVALAEEADIYVSTSSVIKETDARFGLTAVLGIDNMINRVDFRASERVFALLLGVVGLTQGRLLIQTGIPSSPIFSALKNYDFRLFYDSELRHRKQLGLPPFRHLIMVKVRAKNESRAKAAAEQVFDVFKQPSSDKTLKVISLHPANPQKLRGNYCWQVILGAGNVKRASSLIKSRLRSVPRSGAIVTVDVDPL